MVLNYLLYGIIGVIGGLHSASYGAYKDSPYESFVLRRFVREIILAFFIGILLSFFYFEKRERYFVIFLVIMGLSRTATEFYKLFLREENQDPFLIPTQAHFFKKVVKNKILRIALGFFCIMIIYAIFLISVSLPDAFSKTERGLYIGFLTGFITAVGGGYKDGFFEGFNKIKFFRSPVIGAIGGVLIALNTEIIFFILFGAIGFERMIVELYKGFLKRRYSPGKFKLKNPKYVSWFNRRKIFILPYSLTWLFFIILLFI